MGYKNSNQSSMYSLVEKYLSRTTTQQKFCEDNSISKSTLGYWVCKYNRENRSEQTDFVKLTPERTFSSEVTVHLPNGLRITGSGRSFVATVTELYRATL